MIKGTAIGCLLLFVVISACGRSSPNKAIAQVEQLTFDGAEATSEDARMRHGDRLAELLGCKGCHKRDFTGGPFNEGWIAPNVSLLAADHDHAQFENAVRQGVASDGRKLRMMPSEMYRSLSDPDMRALSTYLLALEPKGEVQAEFVPFPSDLAQWEADGYTDGYTLGLEWAASPGPVDAGPEHARGRYLAQNLCTECHNNQLQGYPNFTPDLMIVSAYSDEEFVRLLQEGKGNTRDQLGLMSLVSPSRYPYLTDEERLELFAYLRARAEILLGD